MASSPGGANTFVPSLEATGQLRIDYSRNVDSFAHNNYAKMIPVDKQVGHYLSFTSDESARITNTALDKYVWQDGAEAPLNLVEKDHDFPTYTTRRYAYAFTLGNLSIEQAEWDVVASYSQTAASKAMTGRSAKIIAALEGGTWTGSTATATSAGGGKWDVSGSNDRFIKKSLNAGVQNIVKKTNGVVGPKDLVLVISPDTAGQMADGGDATDGEIHSYMAQSPFALDAIGQRQQLMNYGLPSHLYGIQVVVEDTVLVSSKPNATRSDAFALTNTNAFLLSRPQGLIGTNGSTLSSTICVFSKEELTVEIHDDQLNRRVIGRVVDDFVPVLTGIASGYYFSAVVD